MSSLDTGFRVEAYFIHRGGLLSIASPGARARLAKFERAGDSNSLDEARLDATFAEAAVESIAVANIQPARIALLHGGLRVGQLLWEELAVNIRGTNLYARYARGLVLVRRRTAA